MLFTLKTIPPLIVAWSAYSLLSSLTCKSPELFLLAIVDAKLVSLETTPFSLLESPAVRLVAVPVNPVPGPEKFVAVADPVTVNPVELKRPL
ncbi:hypothetical protein D3C84_838510 [compost metagenome]